ncbi:hypothetical protein ACIRPX_37170 [Streptomyces sp. NPDC101225]|uniref:hypothetical protein n=1 Tax=Streptomyces sp. NPDC101225 TaxID=3366135 RepID=UPI0037F59079
MTQGRPLIEPTSLFSALEGQPRGAAAVSPPPATNPFQAPDFGEDEAFLAEAAPEPTSGRRPARRKAA